MQASHTSPLSKWRILVLLTVAGATISVLFGLSIQQDDVSEKHLDEADAHAATAAFLQSAEDEGALASQALRSFVETGDQTFIAQVQEHAGIAVANLTDAASTSGSPEVGALSSGGLGLADGAGRVIGLRSAGDVEGAAAELQQLSPQFEALTQSLEASMQSQLDEAASLQDSANTASDAASWLRIAALSIAGLTIVAIGFTAARSIFGRRASRAAAS